MGMKHFKAYTPSRRNMTVSTFEEITKKTPEKSLLATKKKIIAASIEKNIFFKIYPLKCLFFWSKWFYNFLITN